MKAQTINEAELEQASQAEPDQDLTFEKDDLSDQNLEAVAGGTAFSVDSSAAALNIPNPSAGIISSGSQPIVVTGSMSAPAGVTTTSTPTIATGTTMVTNPDGTIGYSSLSGSFTKVTPRGQTAPQPTSAPFITTSGMSGIAAGTPSSSSSK